MNLRPSRFALCLLVLCTLPALCAAQTPAVWKPDPKLLAQLGPEVSVGDFKVRPPQGYEALAAKVVDGDNGTTTKYKFRSAQWPDGTHAYLDVNIITSKPGFHPAPLDDLAGIYGKDVLSTFTHPTKSPTEHGILGNIPAIRFYWKGIGVKDNSSLHGLWYSVVIGHSIVLVLASDREPHNTTSLPLMEAAALTFRKG